MSGVSAFAVSPPAKSRHHEPFGIVVLDAGRVVLDDTPERVRSNKMLQEIYFGTGENGSGTHKAVSDTAGSVAGAVLKEQSVAG